MHTSFHKLAKNQYKSNSFLIRTLFVFIGFVLSVCITAQNVGINATGALPDNSAMLDISSTTKGVLTPRMSTPERLAVDTSIAATGLIVYDTGCQTFCYWNGSSWVCLGNGSGISTPGVITGTTAVCSGSAGVPYSITAVSGADTNGYYWTLPAGASIASGQGTTDITVNFGSSAGSICVTASDNCGTSNPACLTVTISALAPTAPVATAAINTTCTTFIANWNVVNGATTYSLDVATDAGFTSLVAGYSGLPVGNVLTYQVTGLSSGTTYYYRVRCANSCGTSGNSNTITVSTDGAGTTHGSQTFLHKNSVPQIPQIQKFTVPCGITSVTVEAYGGQGGKGYNAVSGNTPSGGLGGKTVYSFTVTQNQTINVYVGEKGHDYTSSMCVSPAFGDNSGGTARGGLGGYYTYCSPKKGGGGGGGSSDVRTGGNLNTRVVVAGGGGGGSNNNAGGAGGGTTGAAGSGGTSGAGGSQTAGGAGGTNSSCGNGSAGAWGTGGDGKNSSTCSAGAGGGGGGYYGGGGGGANGSGGGGSSYPPGATTITQGVQTGDGMVIIYW